MKKTLIALAVAGTFAAPAFAATSNVDIYGVMSFSVDQINDGNQTAGADKSDLNAGVDNVSRIGFKGSEDLGGGMKAIWQIEEQIGATAGAFAGHRNTFVGLGGGFGTVVLGRHDTPYKLGTGSLDPFADTIGDYNAIIGRSSAVGAGTMFDVRAPQTVAYISPTVSGFHAAVAYISIKANEGAGADETTGWSATGIYSNGPLFGSLSYENHKGGLNTVLGLPAGTVAAAVQGSNAWKLGLGYTFGDTKVGVVYEDQSVEGINANDHKSWYASLKHDMGPIALKAAYGKADDGEGAGVNNGATFWTLGADYALSKRTTAYAVYADLNNDGVAVTGGSYDLGGAGYAVATSGATVKGLSLGIKHTF